MCLHRWGVALLVVTLINLVSVASSPAATGDFDGNGYVDNNDYFFLAMCLTLSGPGDVPGVPGCLEVFDVDADTDVDLVDYASFSKNMGHLPMPLMDTLGDPITIDSTRPYSPRQTCGQCHEHAVEAIENGEWFQQGRTNLDGQVDMHDDYDGDGKFWIKSAGRYGKWGQSFQFQLAAKDNTHPSQIDQTTFAWVRDCSGCHSGGGPGEFDRDGELHYNEATGQFGYEVLGKTAEDVALDGDYSVLDRTAGTVSLAPWDVTGVSEADCLLCHRDNRPTVNGTDMVTGWRSGVLAAGASLVDNQGTSVPAYAAASTAGQGWFSANSAAAAKTVSASHQDLSPADLAFIEEPRRSPSNVAATTTLQIDYSIGVADGSLLVNENDEVLLAGPTVGQKALDQACVSCHPLKVVAGEVWFDDRDIHYRKFNRLNDDDPDNDIPAARSAVCGVCHPAGLDHNAAKGNSFQLQYRNELDYVGFRTCRNCHLTELPNGEPNPLKHPESPDVPGDTPIHQIGFAEGENGPMRVMSCQACHIPYALTAGLFFRDITIPGNLAWTSQYLSADPLNPQNADKSKWYPPLLWKKDTDGVERLFPASVWINIYFGDWNRNGTPDDLSDDVIAPIYTWRVAQVVGGSPLPVLTDDDGDGRLEIDRPEEILVYLKTLRLPDANGVPVATNPVLVRGPRVWYFDPQVPSGVNYFYHEDKGIPITSYPYIWGMDHNVRPAVEAWGAGEEPESCNTCHRNDGQSPVFDRKVLTDPHGLDGKPEYTTVKEMVKVYPFHSRIILKDYLGNPVTAGSTAPYSGRQTCGGPRCHDTYHVTNGAWFQDGRTDVNNEFDMKDDYNDDGRYWIKSAGRYGKWGQSFQYLLAAKENTNPSQIDQPTFNWVRDCSGCHPGSGPGEWDRDGQLHYDETTGLFGYEVLGKTPEEVQLDGDYTRQDYATGTVTPAPWDVTGLSGPDCLFCHRADRPQVDGTYMSLTWRRNTLAAGENLVDEKGNLVPAFSAAGTAGQGWFSTNTTASVATKAIAQSQSQKRPADVAFLDAMLGPLDGARGRASSTSTLQIDYSVGVDNGSLVSDALTGVLSMGPTAVTYPPKDLACWQCHPYGTITGTVWFDDRDIHYRKFNLLNDDDPYNDIPPEESRVCTYCHPGTFDHNIGKGNSPQLKYRNELDYVNFRTCRNCHLSELPNGDPNPLKHPEAPDVPGDIQVHREGFALGDRGPMNTVSCQGCHIPYALTEAVVFRDITIPGSVGTTSRYYSTDPLDPWAEDDDDRWYPGFVAKEDVDGVVRIFPANIWIMIYFADWDQNGTPEDLADDVIAPLFTWRVAQAVGSTPLPVVTDDDNDGRLEINRPEEILAYISVLKGLDANGEQIAANPVLVRGKRVFYEDPDAPGGVGSFEHERAGVAMEAWYPYIWAMDHNIRPAEESWGADPDLAPLGCRDCHRPAEFNSPVFDRLILVDPCNEDGEEVYLKVRQMTGLNPP